MNPVETLREAARLMRERAEDTTAVSVWTADANAVREPHGVCLALTYGDAAPSRPVAKHIASWHPAVALAVADWLRNTADHVAWNQQEGIDLPAEMVPALAVARTYLGEES